MPLGDGKGPPDGTGPMSGRRRLGDACRSLVNGAGDERRSSSTGIALLVVGVVLLATALVSSAFDRD